MSSGEATLHLNALEAEFIITTCAGAGPDGESLASRVAAASREIAGEYQDDLGDVPLTWRDCFGADGTISGINEYVQASKTVRGTLLKNRRLVPVDLSAKEDDLLRQVVTVHHNRLLDSPEVSDLANSGYTPGERIQIVQEMTAVAGLFDQLVAIDVQVIQERSRSKAR